eukprot:6639540-Lingulodinium_polyedra.AAC.1
MSLVILRPVLSRVARSRVLRTTVVHKSAAGFSSMQQRGMSRAFARSRRAGRLSLDLLRRSSKSSVTVRSPCWKT